MGYPGVGFEATETQITTLMCDEPQESPERHAHMEAHVYILEGEGHPSWTKSKCRGKRGRFCTSRAPAPCTSTSTRASESRCCESNSGCDRNSSKKSRSEPFRKSGRPLPRSSDDGSRGKQSRLLAFKTGRPGHFTECARLQRVRILQRNLCPLITSACNPGLTKLPGRPRGKRG